LAHSPRRNPKGARLDKKACREHEVTLNGKEVAAKTFTVLSDPKATDWTHVPEEVVYTEGDHYYFVRYEYVGETIQVSVGASFKD